MHLESKILYFVSFCGFVFSQNNKNNVQDDIQMCNFDKGIRLRAEYSTIDVGSTDVITWTPCMLDSRNSICPQNSLICMNGVVNLGSSFKLVKGFTKNTYRLQSQNGDACKANRTRIYVVYISFNEYSIKPHLLQSSDNCEFHIGIPDPMVEHPCTKRVKGHLIDFRFFTDDFRVRDGDDTYIFNLCSAARGCEGDQISSCVVGSRNMSFGQASKRIVSYNEEDGVVQFKFKYDRLSTKVDLNCNWDTISSQPRYLKSVSSNNMKKFVLDSSLGCVKLPMECTVEDMENYKYDISSLYKTKGNWKVENKLNRNIEINICGPLQNSRKACKDQYSQVCETLDENTFLNYGSILVGKDVKGDNIKARLVHGSICPKNSSFTLNTDLTFKCSFKERGPRLFNSTDCSLDILWETPKACPSKVKIEQELSMHDRLGYRDLRGLCDRGDRTRQINESYYITYNLCAPLKQPCNNIMNVGACLSVNGKQTVLGYYSDEKLISKDGILSMEFFGEPCKNLNVYFLCDYAEAKYGQVTNLDIKHDNCVYNMHIKTAEACVSKANLHPEKYCSVKNGTLFYNLASLAKTSSNYKFVDKKSDAEYIMNICNPVVTESDALCKRGVNICIFNRTEPNIKHRFISIGVQSNLPKISGDKIIVEFQSGDLCPNKEFASGIIYFKCSNNEVGPKLIEEKDCFYKFSWQTPHACPKSALQCLIPFQNGFLDLEGIENKEFSIPDMDQSNFLFNICSDNYTRIYKDGRNETVKAQREAQEKSLTFHLNNVCNDENGANWNKINIIFYCAEAEEDIFEFILIKDCTAYVKCKTKSKTFCKQVDSIFEKNLISEIFDTAAEKLRNFQAVAKNTSKRDDDVPAKSERHVKIKENHTETSIVTTTINKMILNTCTITYGEEEIHLNQLPQVTLISHSTKRYNIGLGNSSECNGYICRENLTIATLSVCPKGYTEDTELKIMFNETIPLSGGRFITTITFKCNLTMEFPRISGENENSVSVIYPMDGICPKPSSNTGLIVGIVFLVIILAALVSFVTYRSCWKRKYWMLGEQDDKSNMYLYARNSQD